MSLCVAMSCLTFCTFSFCDDFVVAFVHLLLLLTYCGIKYLMNNDNKPPSRFSKSLDGKLHSHLEWSYKLHNLHGTLTFETEVLLLVSNVQLVKQLLL